MKTIDEQIKCVLRELALREAVYARHVSEGKMQHTVATHELACMRAVLTTLEDVKKNPRLF